MIFFYTKYNVIESFDAQALLKLSFKGVKGMRNAPSCFRKLSWDGSESGEWKSGRNHLAYEIDKESGIIAFRVALVDENDELWSTDIALNEKNHEIQLRLTREKRIVSAEYDRKFHVPYIFKKIIRDGFGGLDIDLPVCDKPIIIDEDNVGIAADIITRRKSYSLPVIYVSHPFSGDEYEVDVIELAKDMAGSAHVLVEKSSKISNKIKKLTKGKNAYNGAVDVFYDDDSFRYLKWKGIKSNQFRFKISHAVYSRMAMRNIDDESTLSAIRLRNKIKKLDSNSIETQLLSLENEELREKRKEDSDFIELGLEEIKNLNKRVYELENYNFDLKNKIIALNAALNKKNNPSANSVAFDYTEKAFYNDEVKRMILKSIGQMISTYGPEEQLRRDYHVLKNVCDNNTFSDEGNCIKREMLQILRKKKLGKSDVNSLKRLGFEVQSGGHDKYVFHHDDRYIITVSSSPSDYREGENVAHDAVNLIFGRT